MDATMSEEDRALFQEIRDLLLKLLKAQEATANSADISARRALAERKGG